MSTSTTILPPFSMSRLPWKERMGTGPPTFDPVSLSIRRGSDLKGSGGRLRFFSQKAILCSSRRWKACRICLIFSSGSSLSQLCAPTARTRPTRTGTRRALISSPFRPPTLYSIGQKKAQGDEAAETRLHDGLLPWRIVETSQSVSARRSQATNGGTSPRRQDDPAKRHLCLALCLPQGGICGGSPFPFRRCIPFLGCDIGPC